MPITIDRELMKRRQRSPLGAVAWISRLIGVGCCIGGVLGVTNAVRGIEAMRWPSVPGVIESTEIRSDTVGWNGARSPTPLRADRFYATYSYSVDDRRYSGRRVDVFMPIGKSYPHQLQTQYPSGKAVEVHVNPKDATDAVLEAPWPLGSLMQAIVGLLIGVLLLRWSFGVLRSPRDTDCSPFVRDGGIHA